MSQDGITWQPVNTNILFWLPDVIFAQGKFVAVGAQRFTSASTKPLVAVSTNGVDWTNKHVPSPAAPALICLDKKTGKLLGAEQSGISARTYICNWSSPA